MENNETTLNYEDNAKKMQEDYVNRFFKEGMDEQYKKRLQDTARDIDSHSRQLGQDIETYNKKFNDNAKNWWGSPNKETNTSELKSPKVEQVKQTQTEWKPESQQEKTKQSFVESPIVYEGGKGRYLSQIKPYFPKDRVKKSYDAFSGGLNVALNMDADEVVANELDKNIYGIQNELKNTKAPEMVNYLKDTINKYGLRDVNNFNKFVENWNKSPNKNYKDLYLIKSLMKGGRLQFDKNGNIIYKDEANGNVYPRYDRAKGQTWLNKSSGDLRNKLINLRKSNITLSNDDAMNVIDKAQKGEFVYCDPPYSNTKAAYNDNWTIKDDYRLFKSLDNATRKGVKWAMSNVLDNNEHIEQWARKNGYNIYPIRTNYHGKLYNEVLITNYDE